MRVSMQHLSSNDSKGRFSIVLQVAKNISSELIVRGAVTPRLWAKGLEVSVWMARLWICLWTILALFQSVSTKNVIAGCFVGQRIQHTNGTVQAAYSEQPLVPNDAKCPCPYSPRDEKTHDQTEEQYITQSLFILPSFRWWRSMIGVQ